MGGITNVIYGLVLSSQLLVQDNRQTFVKDGILVHREQRRSSLGISHAGLLGLVFAADEIPQMEAKSTYHPEYHQRYHTVVTIDAYSDGTAEELNSKINRAYVSRFDKREQVGVDLTIRSSAHLAARSMDRIIENSSARLEERTYSGLRIGRSVSNPVGGVEIVQIGRCVMRVGTNDRSSMLCDALALSLEYKLRARDDMQAPKEELPLYFGSKKISGFNALEYNGNSWAPVEAFKSAGIAVEWDGSSYTAVLKHNAKRVVMKCLQYGAFVNGEYHKWRIPCLLVNYKMVIPLRETCQELGLKFETQNGRVTITPQGS